MKQLKKILFLIVIMTSLMAFDQKNKSKTVRLKGTDYKIEVPKKYKLRPQKGVDFLFYSIKNKSKKDSVKEIGIYLGYYPNEVGNSNYDKIDSLNIKILDNREKFMIYKYGDKFLIEGFILENKHEIKTNIYHKKKLQFHMYGITTNKNELNKIGKIFSSIK